MSNSHITHNKIFAVLVILVVIFIFPASAVAQDPPLDTEPDQAEGSDKILTPEQAEQVEESLSSKLKAETNVVSSASVSRHKKTTPKDLVVSPNNQLQAMADSGEVQPGEQLFIVRLADPAIATYEGGITNLRATNPRVTGANKLDVNTATSQAYSNHLTQERANFVSRMNREINRQPEIVYEYEAALNGLAVRLDLDEALKVSQLPGVTAVIPDWTEYAQTDFGPAWMNADAVWDGSATGVASQGEGIVVGIIDTGINMDHPSFADVGADGYDHTNPRGKFFGWCDPTHPDYDPTLVCNDKLIGVWSGDEDSPEDADSHGTHVGSTVAGNFILNPVINAPTVVLTNPTTISGVAPHANIIGYNIEGAPGTGSASGATIIAATEQAIADQVDVINYSFGGGAADPWVATEHWFNVREAGIFVATSAGNDGSAEDTIGSPANAPWVMTVAASSHNRVFRNVLQNLTGGDTPPFSQVDGEGLTSGYGPAPIVYAGDIDPNNVGCDLPYPPNTFNGEIVVCDYNDGPQYGGRVNKSVNLAAAGAGGFILINRPDWGIAQMVDSYAIPGMGIPYDDGEALKVWLSSGSGHQGQIRGVTIESARGDIMAGFSSRGPNGPLPDLIKPDVSAPGRRILAAIGTTDPTDPPEFDVFQGTSMSSPHAAGAAALVRALHPDWTVAEMQSALMTTGIVNNILKEDGQTQADPFDIGGGRIDVSLAVQAGLILDETPADLWAANPDTGGDPTALNLASLGNSQCVQICSWSRTVRNPLDQTVSWTVSTETPNGLSLNVSPAAFTLGPDETQVLEITADTTGSPFDEWIFAQVNFSADDGAAPAANFPVAVKPSSGSLPELLTIQTRRDAGSQLLTDLEAIPITDFSYAAYGLVEGTQIDLDLSGDPSNGDPYDNVNDGTVFFTTVSVPANAVRLVAETIASEAPDIDLFVGTGNTPSADTQTCSSTSGSWPEYCNIENPAMGTWWIVVQNWAASDNPPDAVTLSYAVVTEDEGNLMVEGPTSVPAGTLFDLRVFWDDTDIDPNERWYGAIALGSSPGSVGDIGTIAVNLIRQEDDVQKTVDSLTAAPGDILTYEITVLPNVTPEDLVYTLEDIIPPGLTYIPGSATASQGEVNVNGNILTWSGDMPVPGIQYEMTTSDSDPACDTPFGGYVNLEDFGIFAQPDLEGDSVQFSSNWQGGDANPIEFYGITKPPTTFFTDDGFAFFNSTPGSAPYINQPIPDPTPPNDMMAVYWTDFEIVYDEETNRGVSLATAGPDLSIIEYDDVEPYPAGASSQRFDFEIIQIHTVNDAPGAYEIFFAYDNLNGGLNPVTIGVENLTGNEGVQYLYNDATPDTLYDGLVICFNQVGNNAKTTITYQVTVDEDASGVLTNQVVHSTNNPGSQSATTSVDVMIGSRELINASLDLASMTTNYSSTPTADAPAGVFTISATFNNQSSHTFGSLQFETIILSGNNMLLNADGGPAGKGATLTVPPELLGDNNLLDPDESFTVDFEIGLQKRSKFTFFVDAYGIQADDITTDEALTNNNSGGFRFEIEEQLLIGDGSTLYLPLITSDD